MKTTSALIAVAAAAAGTVGAAWAYDEAAPPVGNPTVSSVDTTVTKPVAQRPRLVWAPCRPPAELRQGECVTDVVHTVLLPAPPAPSTPAPPLQPTPVTEQDDNAPDQARDDRADDDHQDDDHEDDDREDEAGEDDEDHEDEDHEDRGED